MVRFCACFHHGAKNIQQYAHFLSNIRQIRSHHPKSAKICHKVGTEHATVSV
ncbi:hypothetical protein [Moraxella nonliquefaciens]|uniref:hypothetical protein n=1 Tax=Moraxella nonliquefaciens TaxID=478 RepID=UPI001EF5DFF5|nr:hypothetical protein [Moraxella nonliquefaciens]